MELFETPSSGRLEERVPRRESFGEAKARKALRGTGIEINGPRPWDLRVNHRLFYARVLARQSMGLGESYMDGWWDVPRLDEFFYRLFLSRFDEKFRSGWSGLWNRGRAWVFNLQKASRAFQVAERHYDIGNDFFESMLDSRMTYSCGYWKDASTLEEAQEAKLDLVCRKIGLKAGHQVLDVGCGWGSFAKFAAERYGARVTAVTVSREQAEWARQSCRGLPVEIRLQDYRDLRGRFNRIVSLGMFEHVGYKNYRRFMEVAASCLEDDGLFLLHTIGGNRSEKAIDPWIHRYIFPNAVIPSLRQIGTALEGLFTVEDWHNIGADYDPTLLTWFRNLENRWPGLQPRYGPRFFRMWKYFLHQSAGLFRARRKQVWQFVLSKKGVPGGYRGVR